MPFQFKHLSRQLGIALLLLGPALMGQSAPARLSVHVVRREPLVTLPTDISRTRILHRAVPVGLLDAAQTISAALSLPWRNQADLQDLIAHQNDPHSPLYKKWLSATEFDARFAPSAKDYATVIDWARSQGLVAQTFPSRNLLIVHGSASTAAAAFHVAFGRYRLPNGRVAYASTASPRLPRSVALVINSVAGLDDLTVRHPMLRRRTLRPTPYALSSRPYDTVGGSGAGASLTPADIKSAYSLTATDLPDGTGQTLALYELDGYVASDIQTYATAFDLGTPTVQNFLLDGFDGTAGDGQSEVTLDIEMAVALAPAAKILVYEADNSTAGSLAIYNQIADDNLASVVSVSYGLAEEEVSDSERNSENATLKKMIAQGQCVYVSSGDDGSYNATSQDALGNPTDFVVSVSDPASQPNVVAVGGTTLMATVPTATADVPDPVAQYVSETTWNTFTDIPTTATAEIDGASGGGISKYWPKPSYQTGVGASLSLPATAGETVTPMRDVPDVSLNADTTPGYTIFQASTPTDASFPFLGVTQGYTVVGGTSAAAPLWAAFNILVNQKRATFSLGRLGFADSDIYTIAESSSYSTTFHDITTGTNPTYSATAGYDDTTGWGSFIGDALLASLAPSTSDAQTLTVTVTDASGMAVSDASVAVSTPQITSFTNADSTGAYPVTDATGKYTVSLDSLLQSAVTSTPAALTYTVTVEKSGYAGKTLRTVAVPIALAVTLSAPDHIYSDPTALQMISAPYDYTTAGDFLTLFDLTSASLVSGGPNLISYSPSLSRYLLYPSVPADTLRLGQGYWARLSSDGTVRRNGTLAPTNQAFRINLQAGWNQIGDPFLVPVSVGSLDVDSTTAPGSPVSILLSQDVALPLYGYTVSTNSYQTLNAQTDSLQPWAGYWIFAKNAVTLVVPPPGG